MGKTARQAGPAQRLPADPLADLAGRINAAHEACSDALREGVRHALEAGGLLLEAKGKVPHGGWIAWLKGHCRFTLRTAQAYMQAARRFPELGEAKAQRVALLPFREALRELSEGQRRPPDGGEVPADRLPGREEKDAARGERLAGLDMLDSRPLREIIRRVEAVRDIGFFPTASDSGWATDGEFLAKLSGGEQLLLRQLPEGRAPSRPVDVRAVMPRQKDWIPLRVLGEFSGPEGGPFGEGRAARFCALAGRDDPDFLVVVDAGRFLMLRERYPGADVSAGRDGLVVMSAGEETVALLMPARFAERPGDGPVRSLAVMREYLSDLLGQITAACTQVMDGSPAPHQGRGEAEREAAVLAGVAALEWVRHWLRFNHRFRTPLQPAVVEKEQEPAPQDGQKKPPPEKPAPKRRGKK